MPKLTLPSGAVIEGTPDEIAQILGKVDTLDHLVGFYRSDTDGYISITEMHNLHVRSAIAKKYRDWVKDLNELHPRDFIEAVRMGLDDPEFIELCTELARRKARGQLDGD